jgi:hypothetical protein
VIAVAIVKNVDERVLRAGDRIFTPEDVMHLAHELFQLAEYQNAPPRQRDRHDWPFAQWEEASPERRWAFWHRAMQAISEAEAQRRPPAEAAVLDPADPALAIARADAPEPTA